MTKQDGSATTWGQRMRRCWGPLFVPDEQGRGSCTVCGQPCMTTKAGVKRHVRRG